MDPGMIGVFIPILGVVGFFGLMGMKIWSDHTLKMRATPDSGNDRPPGLLRSTVPITGRSGIYAACISRCRSRCRSTSWAVKGIFLSQIRSSKPENVWVTLVWISACCLAVI